MKQVILKEKKPTIYSSDVLEEETYLVKDSDGCIGMVANSSKGWFIRYSDTYLSKHNITFFEYIEYLLGEGYKVFELEEKDF